MFSVPNLKLDPKTIYQDQNLIVKIDEEHKFMYAEWLQHISGQDYRAQFEKLKELSEVYKIEYWLNNARMVHYVNFSDQNWLLQIMVPFIKTTTVKKYARLTSQEGLAMMDISRVIDVIDQIPDFKSKTQFESFISMDAALNWLFVEA